MIYLIFFILILAALWKLHEGRKRVQQHRTTCLTVNGNAKYTRWFLRQPSTWAKLPERGVTVSAVFFPSACHRAVGDINSKWRIQSPENMVPYLGGALSLLSVKMVWTITDYKRLLFYPIWYIEKQAIYVELGRILMDVNHHLLNPSPRTKKITAALKAIYVPSFLPSSPPHPKVITNFFKSNFCSYICIPSQCTNSICLV